MSHTTTLRIPSLTKHKPTGQAVVHSNGKDHFVGNRRERSV